MPSRPRSLTMPAFFGLAGLAYAIASLCGLALTFDGSYYLFRTLDQQATSTPYGRLVNVPLQLPVLATSQLTDDPRLLMPAFSLPYLLVPLVSLLACWWIVRARQPRLFVWPVVGIGLVALPAQPMPVSESLTVSHLTWPILLALLTGYRRQDWLPVVAFGSALALAHPLAVLLLGGLAALAFVTWLARRGPAHGYLGWAVALAALALAALLRTLLSSELNADHLEEPFVTTFRAATAGNVRIMLVLAAAGCLSLVGGSALRRRGAAIWARRSEALAALLLLAGGLALVPWAADPHAWRRALEYRQVVPVSAGIVMVLALADAWLLGAVGRPAPAPPDGPVHGEPDGDRPVRSWIVVSQAAVMLAVLAACSLSWHGLTADLESAMGPGAPTCTSVESLDWAQGTPLDQWAVTSTSLIVQGRAPTRIVAPSCSVDFSPGLAMIPSHQTYTPYDRTWFDLSGLAVLKPEPAAYFEVRIVTPYNAGELHSITIRVRDAEGGMATGYRGTIHFTSSDPAAVLPPDYTFTLKDAGLHYFMYETTLWTPGTQWLAATDTSDPAITGRQDGIEVRQEGD